MITLITICCLIYIVKNTNLVDVFDTLFDLLCSLFKAINKVIKKYTKKILKGIDKHWKYIKWPIIILGFPFLGFMFLHEYLFEKLKLTRGTISNVMFTLILWCLWFFTLMVIGIYFLYATRIITN